MEMALKLCLLLLTSFTMILEGWYEAERPAMWCSAKNDSNDNIHSLHTIKSLYDISVPACLYLCYGIKDCTKASYDSELNKCYMLSNQQNKPEDINADIMLPKKSLKTYKYIYCQPSYDNKPPVMVVARDIGNAEVWFHNVSIVDTCCGYVKNDTRGNDKTLEERVTFPELINYTHCLDMCRAFHIPDNCDGFAFNYFTRNCTLLRKATFRTKVRGKEKGWEFHHNIICGQNLSCPNISLSTTESTTPESGATINGSTAALTTTTSPKPHPDVNETTTATPPSVSFTTENGTKPSMTSTSGTGTPPSVSSTSENGTIPSTSPTTGTGTPPSVSSTSENGTIPSTSPTMGTGTPPSVSFATENGTTPSITPTPGTGTPPSVSSTTGTGTPPFISPITSITPPTPTALSTETSIGSTCPEPTCPTCPPCPTGETCEPCSTAMECPTSGDCPSCPTCAPCPTTPKPCPPTDCELNDGYSCQPNGICTFKKTEDGCPVHECVCNDGWTGKFCETRTKCHIGNKLLDKGEGINVTRCVRCTCMNPLMNEAECKVICCIFGDIIHPVETEPKTALKIFKGFTSSRVSQPSLTCYCRCLEGGNLKCDVTTV